MPGLAVGETGYFHVLTAFFDLLDHVGDKVFGLFDYILSVSRRKRIIHTAEIWETVTAIKTQVQHKTAEFCRLEES